jgi:two-component system response regulator (stage 0 sporulation protein A)
MTDEDPKIARVISKYLYPKLAEKHQTSAINIERGIRLAIERAWRNSTNETLNKLYGNAVDPKKGRPTNAEFITNVAQKLKTEVI